jgi:hypothetical protein
VPVGPLKDERNKSPGGRKNSVINSRVEVDLLEAMDMLDVPEEVLGKLADEGKLKTRHADGTIYFLREEIEKLIDLQIEEVRATGWEEIDDSAT